MTLTLIRRHRGARKQNLLYLLSHKVFRLIWMKIGVLLYNESFSSSRWINIHGRELGLSDLVLKTNGMRTDIWGPISLKLGVMIHSATLNSPIPVWVTLSFSQGHRSMRKQTICARFPQILQSSSTKCVMPPPVDLLMPELNSFGTIDIPGRELCVRGLYEVYVQRWFLFGHLLTHFFQTW